MNKEAVRELRNLATTTAHTAAAARQHATTVATGCGCPVAAAELLRGAVLTSLAAAEAIAAEIATGDPATDRAELATLIHDLEGVTGRARLSGRMLGWLMKNVAVNRVWVISTIQHACAEEYDARMPRVAEKLERLRGSDWTEPETREAADRIASFTPAQ